ncbi:c-type cytochrome [Marinobacter sp.]|uniref:c-type cytochrome n=1 Tax=Marinobacter sp. TaxID=50741 RepID=UPI003A8E3E11
MFDRCYGCERMLNTVVVTLLAGKASYAVLLFGALFLGMQTTLLRAEDTPQLLTPELGEPLHPSDIENYEITIFPNGKNLPEGQGTVAEGEVLYQTQCAMCHGKKGIEGPAARLAGSDGWFSFRDPLRVLRIRKHPVLLISVGSMWPFATTIFDYIRRAMPHQAPKSLNNDEVYALTAYILHLNDLLNTATQLDKHSILEINMPGKTRSVIAD